MATKAVAIIGARLNSSRLPGKHLLDLAGKPLIARLVDRLRTCRSLDQIILATTSDDYNQPLVNWGAGYGVETLAFDGDVNDLMDRVDAAVNLTDAKIVVYICGDSPLVDPDTIDMLVEALDASGTADLAQLAPLPAGKKYIHEGFDVYRRSFWNEMMGLSQSDFEREHVGSVYHHFKKLPDAEVCSVKGDPVFYSIDHRISVDTPSDYRFMKALYKNWYGENRQKTIVSLPWVIKQIQQDPDLRRINDGVRQKTVTDRSKKVWLITEAGGTVGLGHLSRCMMLANFLQDTFSAGVHVSVVGDAFHSEKLNLVPHAFVPSFESLKDVSADLCIMDVKTNTPEMRQMVEDIKSAGCTVVGIDHTARYFDCDAAIIPCHYVDEETRARYGDALLSGWESYLIPDMPVRNHISRHTKRIGVFAGGADRRLAEFWAEGLDKALPQSIDIDVFSRDLFQTTDVSGAMGNRLHIKGFDAQLSLKLSEYDVFLCVHGVTLFEAIKARVPTVALIPEELKGSDELRDLADVAACVLSHSREETIQAAVSLAESYEQRLYLSEVMQKLDIGSVEVLKNFLSAYLDM
ncbi:acylneuraminate cytidylyltransferase [Kordiimonas sediminis]|uniref:Acylneuraminate cytidylyltransferase n=1 Tax=Kordiimonas sediminis TaxID=1735581 RepID=A0A919AXB1_9PROT|nr:NTP transferase domain-containing protein [Kordiimonas sediminis]GHF29511.1 acylneuraminate cytidylyltransferase [Kordiimonas sediminis]